MTRAPSIIELDGFMDYTCEVDGSSENDNDAANSAIIGEGSSSSIRAGCSQARTSPASWSR
jgi:hypothetical protein